MSAERVERILEGSCDLHVHPYPSPFPRRIDAVQAAESAAALKMRAIVVKSHHHDTSTDVIAQWRFGLETSPVKVYGAVALNGQVGGLNPRAVNMCLAMGGRVIWFPTIAAPGHIASQQENPDSFKFPTLAVPLIPEEPIEVWQPGTRELKPEVHEILDMIAAADAVLASGHMDPESIIAVFAAAKERGVRRMIVNHPNFVINASHSDARRMCELGAYIEHSLSMYDEESIFYSWGLETLLEWIEEVGPERTVMGSDLGQMNNPLPADNYRKLCGRLLDAGVGEDALRAMFCDNPAAVIGVDR